MKPNFAAEVPFGLQDADRQLYLYGRWAMNRRRIHVCGSAEKAFRAPQDDTDRQGREILMRDDDALAIQRRLALLPVQERTVLAILYVPRRQPVERLLRRAGIGARRCQELHLRGLHYFSRNYAGPCEDA